MNVIYPRWVGADGIMLITPVYWYQAPSPLKLMIDRLVRADGGNPAPTTTQGKDAAMAKQWELDGWSYPKHSKDEFTVWWFMVTWQVPKVCAEPYATGWTGWDLWTPGKWLAWIAISATTIPTLPAMTNRPGIA
ncbi:NAD(P)H-dependent oxidoreductase [Pseudomonas ogarae]|jgi:multimeric flavodoxin WrbA